MSKLSIVIPVYYNEDTLQSVYDDILAKAVPKIEENGDDWEIVFVNDGSEDKSWEIIVDLQKRDNHVVGINLSRNFGSHSASTCGILNSSGDCFVIKAADLQEPTQLIVDMFDSWKHGNKVVLAVRTARNDGAAKNSFANLFYWLTKRVALKNMPEGGFDVFLIDRSVANVIKDMDEINSPLPMQILWSGFQTALVPYERLGREVGESKWTLKKKLKYVSDMLFSFSTVPITAISVIGVLSFISGAIWSGLLIILRLAGKIIEIGWTSMFALNLITFGITMLSISILGGYLWRTFESSKKRPLYIVDKKISNEKVQTVLRSAKLKDSIRMLEWMNDPEIAKNFNFLDNGITLEEVENFIQNAKVINPQSDENIHLICADGEDQYQGTISLKNINRESGRAEMAIAFHKDCQGSGVAKDAVEEMFDYAKYTLGLNTIYLNHKLENHRAHRFYEKMGWVNTTADDKLQYMERVL